MRGHDQLRARVRQPQYLGQERHLPQLREPRLGLVEHIEPLAAEAARHEREDALAMRAGVQRPSTEVATVVLERVHLRYEVEQRVRAHEEAVARPADAPEQAHVVAEFGVVVVHGERVVARAALGVEAVGDAHRLQQRRLARPVLAAEERDALGQVELMQARDGRHVERVRVPAGNACPVDGERGDEDVVAHQDVRGSSTRFIR